MANKQTLPSLGGDTSKGFINTPSGAAVQGIKFDSGWKKLGSFSEGIVGGAQAFKDLKYTEMLAELNNVQQQDLHKIEDAKDPCELPQIISDINTSYDNMFKDNPYGKSFYASDTYKAFKLKSEAKIAQKSHEQMHKFNMIQATATANAITNDMALMDSPESMMSSLRVYNQNLANVSELTATEKFKLYSDAVQEGVGRVYSNDPNKAVALLDYAGDELGKWGVNVSKYRRMAKDYNIQRQRLALAIQKEQRLAQKEAAALQKEEVLGNAYTDLVRYKLGESGITSEDMQAIALDLTKRYGDDGYTFYTKAFPTSKTETQKQIITQAIGSRINALENLSGEDREKEIKEIEQEIAENRNLGYVAETQEKQWYKSLHKEYKFDLKYFEKQAETGSLTDTDLNLLDDAEAEGNIKDTQRSAIIRKNERNLDVAQYQNQILKGEITTNEQIDNLPLNNEQKVTLKGNLKNHRADLGLDNPEIEKAYEGIYNRDYEQVLSALKKTPASKRGNILSSWKNAILEDQTKNFEELSNRIARKQLTKEQLDFLYDDYAINRSQYQTLKADLLTQSVEDVRNNAANLAQDIINGDIKTISQLNERYANADVNSPYYVTNYNALTNLLKKENAPYYDLLNRAYSQIDRMMTKDALGNNTAISVQRAAEAKKQVLYIFDQNMKKDSITLDKMGELLSPNNIAVLALAFQVNINDLAMNYKTITEDYDREGIVNTLGNMTPETIRQLEKEDFVSESELEKKESPKGESDNKTLLDEVGDWLNSFWGHKEEKRSKNRVITESGEGLTTEQLEQEYGDAEIELEML